jgi:mono/diheme cytochrome c family protein
MPRDWGGEASMSFCKLEFLNPDSLFKFQQFMRKKLPIGYAAFLFLFGVSCRSGPGGESISTDSLAIARGASQFIQKCSGCHNFRQDGIGPQLSGITSQISVARIQQFIQDPKKIIGSGDERARDLFKKFHSVMPSFGSLTPVQMNDLMAYLNVHRQAVKIDNAQDSRALKNPIPKPIELSSLVVELRLLAQIPPSSDSGKLPLTRITKLASGPDGSGPFILDLRGKLFQLTLGHPEIYLNLARLRPLFIHEPGLATGFGSFAFHPDFRNNGLLYTTHTEPRGSAQADFGFEDSIKPALQWVLTEWKTDHPEASVFSGTPRELLRVDMVSGIHGIQEIAFNPLAKPGNEDYGLLYIGIGDGGCVENGYPYLAHSQEKIWGTLLRIDPLGKNSAHGKYGIPPGNPFSKIGDSGILKEIYAYGFRNPHRICWTKTGQILVSNVGHSNIESVNLIIPGGDYGWPIREGSFALNPYGDLTKVYPLPPDDSAYHIVYPVAEYDHDEGRAICGGFDYWGQRIVGLKGKFLFGDIPTGRLFYLDLNEIHPGKPATIREWRVSIHGKIRTLKELCGTDRVDLHFGRDALGNLYILTKPDGKVYLMENATQERK